MSGLAQTRARLAWRQRRARFRSRLAGPHGGARRRFINAAAVGALAAHTGQRHALGQHVVAQQHVVKDLEQLLALLRALLLCLRPRLRRTRAALIRHPPQRSPPDASAWPAGGAAWSSRAR